MKWCVVVLVLSVAASVALARPRWNELDSYTFEQYELDFSKRYMDATEREARRTVFLQRLEEIRAHNANLAKTWREGVNHLTDRTEEELKQMRGYLRAWGYASRDSMDGGSVTSPYAVRSRRDNPPSVDWREKNIVSAVKDQGQCGSCWSFATAETIESHWAMLTGQLAVLSEQSILSCAKNPLNCGGTGGCSGGTAEVGFRTIMELQGVPSEWTYPYTSYWGSDSQCGFDAVKTPGAANVTGYTKLPTNQYEPLMDAIASQGPIAISVDASAWSKYESGVFDGCDQENPVIDHAVQLVGYGDDNTAGPYWLVRNSWAPTWGENGYIRLKRHTSNAPCGVDTVPLDGTGCEGGPANVTVCGTCGILYDNSFPKVSLS